MFYGRSSRWWAPRAALTAGIVGVLSGLVVVLFPVAFALGAVAIVLGGLQSTRAAGRRTADIALGLGLLSIALGVAGVTQL